MICRSHPATVLFITLFSFFNVLFLNIIIESACCRNANIYTIFQYLILSLSLTALDMQRIDNHCTFIDTTTQECNGIIPSHQFPGGQCPFGGYVPSLLVATYALVKTEAFFFASACWEEAFCILAKVIIGDTSPKRRPTTLRFHQLSHTTRIQHMGMTLKL